VALWGALGAAARRYLERARDLEWEQERRLLEAYVRGRDQRRRGRKRRNREQERRLLGTHRRLRTSILLATDGSEDAALAAQAAADLSDRARARLHVVHVWQGLRPATLPAAAIDQYSRTYEAWEREAGELLEEQTERLRSAGGIVAGAHLRAGRPAEEIVALAEELDAGLVVLGSRGLGAVKRLVAGSVAEGVVSLAPCPTLVMRGGEGAWPPTRIVVGVDLSEEARKASELAMSLAGTLGAEVLLIMAYLNPMPVSRGTGFGALAEADRAKNRAWEALSGLSAGLENVGGVRPKTRAILGDAAVVIQEAAEEEESTLVVVGRRGMGGVRRFVLGSVSSDVMRSASGPVLIVPAPDGA
jgi:nucleotide-binding universal stress UspA family protein